MSCVYLQPKYMEKFKCDGRNCPANCCRRNWRIEIDAETFHKYLQSESAEHELTRHIFSDGDKFFISQENGACPFLNADGLCTIQLERGEENISQICRDYPRQLYKIGALIERSLSLSCPLAAQLILSEEQIEFETREIELPDWANRQLIVCEPPIPPQILPYAPEIQLTAISLLRERRLTLDQRLIILGFYLRQVEEIFNRGDFETISTLDKVYTSEEFFLAQVPVLIDSVKFQRKEFVKLMTTAAKTIRGGAAQKFIAQIDFDFGGKVRKKFFRKYAQAMENFLVNEFFGGVYPFRIDGTIQHNYAVFAVTFKLVETTALSLFVKNSSAKILNAIGELAVDLNHNEEFIRAVTDFLRDDADITILMKKFFLKGVDKIVKGWYPMQADSLRTP